MKLRAVIVILTIIVFVIIIGFYSASRPAPNQPPVVENDITTTPAEITTSIYDGTYSGVFNYEYKDQDRFSGKIITPWTPGSFTLTVTFKTIPYLPDPRVPTLKVEVTKAIISDPSFGTGSEGVVPQGEFGGKSTMYLPIDPSKYEADTHTELTMVFRTAGYDTSYKSTRINIRNGTIKVSPDGQTLSNDPNWIDKFPDIKKDLANKTISIWTADTGTSEGTFRKVTLNTNNDRLFKYGSWSLVKIH